MRKGQFPLFRSWSVEYVAGQQDGLQARKECLWEEMDHAYLVCPRWKTKKSSKEVTSK